MFTLDLAIFPSFQNFSPLTLKINNSGFIDVLAFYYQYVFVLIKNIFTFFAK